jgi:ribonuclease BN (tRNA processing enzyme)
MKVGNILKKQHYINQVIIKHEHPDWGYGKNDFVHQKNMSDFNYDLNIYKIRESNNFYL